MVDGTQAEVPGRRVLLVDDDDLVRSAYQRILSRAGFEVAVASNGRDASARMACSAVDVVLSDIAMPGQSGLELLRDLQGQDPDMPVVLMTAAPVLETAVQAMEYGAVRYLSKPVDSTKLIEALETALRNGAATRRNHAQERAATAGRAGLEAQFEMALTSINMAWQPIVSWPDRTVVAFEALLRSRTPEMSRPDQILAAAETLDRVHELGRAIRQAVARDIPSLPNSARAFVNLHPRDLADPELFLPTDPLAPFASRVVLEITERASLDELENFPQCLATLRTMGYQLAIDDLGAGYSGLKSLAEIKPEVVKLDMSLVRGVDRDPTRQKLIAAMNALCEQLGIYVVTEGVETVEERDMLASLGCRTLQGYLFGRPGPAFPVAAF